LSTKSEIKEAMMEQWDNHFFNGENISEGIMKEYEYKYKVAVVAIAKDEEQFVSRWAQSAKAPNTELWILDTGSSDSTVEFAKREGVNVLTKTFTPWRFDEARNYLLSLLPDDIDYVINLDLDEVPLMSLVHAISMCGRGKMKRMVLRVLCTKATRLFPVMATDGSTQFMRS